MKTGLFSFVFFCILGITSSCREDVDASALAVYDGPMRQTENVHLLQSDSAIVRFELTAPLQLEFANGNVEFPEGIEIKMFEKEGELSTTIIADKGYFYKQENLYKGVGNVQVHNLIKDQKLQSEELFYDRIKKKIYTEKFVRVQNGDMYSFGSAFEADETFSTYKLKNSRDGQVPLSDNGL
ncbi:LPS export ABC transporter periplasmic protein LptC [Algoriphagus resistens]|uniref:LPS export ABC transporter periplasmic protein LptC n=1 Tax=Algoriphagus resistens TaxID=1750590 RepID=UPI000ADA5708|nr:LPS export ABC transporter periplasmic protein LptC [Algoriphagus resistens]